MSHPIAEAQKSSGGLMENVTNIFVKPSATFERTRHANFVMPALVQTLLFAVLVLAMKNLITPYFDAEMSRVIAQAAAKGTPLPENAQDMMRKTGAVSALIGPIIAPWLVAIFGGLFTWIAARIVGAKLTYGQSATIASWSAFPSVLGFIAMGVQGALVDPLAIRGVADGQLGPARFLDPINSPPALLSVLQTIDLFGIWGLVLTAIGIAVVARVSLGTGGVASIIKWGVSALITLGFAVLRG